MATPAEGVGGVGGGENVKDGEEPVVVGIQPEAAWDVGGQGHEEDENEAPELVPDPGRVLTAEELHLLTIFPEEVWIRIFDNLREEPQTLLNCMEASPLFRRLLKPTQPTWLFGKIFPHVVDYLTWNETLACRRAGRGWNKAVDNYRQEHRRRRPFNEATYRAADIGNEDDEGLSPRSYGEDPRHHFFIGTTKLIKFMESVGDSLGENPFFDRAVGIYSYYFTTREDELTFWSTVFRFLDEFGKHIWYYRLGAGLACRDARDANGRLLYLMRGCLSRLPNLRSFRLYVSNVDLDPSVAPDLRDYLENVEGEELPAYLQRRPLPMIPSLETLYLDVSREGPVTICEHLVALHQNQLKKMVKFDQLNLLTLPGGLPMLTEFHWKLQSADVDQIENVFLHLNSSPLGKLILRIQAEEDTIDLGRLFELISDNFGNSLRVLELKIFVAIDLDQHGRQEVDATARLGMPHLEALQLSGDCFQQLRIDFLLDVASTLRYLNLTYMRTAQRAEPDQDEQLDIYEYMPDERLYESNIWIRMPKLKRIYMDDVQFSGLYHRETFEFLEQGGQLAD